MLPLRIRSLEIVRVAVLGLALPKCGSDNPHFNGVSCHSLARADTANQTQISSSARSRNLFLQRDRITPLRPRSFAELFLPERAADPGLTLVLRGLRAA